MKNPSLDLLSRMKICFTNNFHIVNNNAFVLLINIKMQKNYSIGLELKFVGFFNRFI